MKPHLLYLALSDEHIGLRIECPGADGGCSWWREDGDLNGSECHCTAGDGGGQCDCCADDDHSGCPDSFFIETIGSSCLCVEEPGSCGVREADCSHEELIAGNDWPKDEYPIRAAVNWVDGYVQLVLWKDGE